MLYDAAEFRADKMPVAYGGNSVKCFRATAFIGREIAGFSLMQAYQHELVFMSM